MYNLFWSSYIQYTLTVLRSVFFISLLFHWMPLHCSVLAFTNLHLITLFHHTWTLHALSSSDWLNSWILHTCIQKQWFWNLLAGSTVWEWSINWQGQKRGGGGFEGGMCHMHVTCSPPHYTQSMTVYSHSVLWWRNFKTANVFPW
jgi:hypothetical protein